MITHQCCRCNGRHCMCVSSVHVVLAVALVICRQIKNSISGLSFGFFFFFLNDVLLLFARVDNMSGALFLYVEFEKAKSESSRLNQVEVNGKFVSSVILLLWFIRLRTF